MRYKGNEREYMREYYLNNKDKYAEYQKEKVAKNPEREREYKRKYRANNKEKVAAYNKKWRQLNPGLVTAHARRYQTTRQRAMPKWLNDEQIKQIKDFYANRPVGHHVDHIMPLKGKNSCGLHVPWNLQYLPITENLKKSNKEPSTS